MTGTGFFNDKDDTEDNERGCQKNRDKPVAAEHAECRSGVLNVINAHPVTDDRDPVAGLHVCSDKIFGKLIDSDDDHRYQWVYKSFHKKNNTIEKGRSSTILSALTDKSW